MNSDVHVLRAWIMVALTAAAFFTTAFPLVYSFSPWYKSALGRSLMLQGVALAAAIDLTLIYQFKRPSSVIVYFWMNAIVLSLVAFASALLTWKVVKRNLLIPLRAKVALMSQDAVLEPAEKRPFLSNRSYDALKYVTQIVLPALGTLYFALSQIWGLPAGEEVVGTVVAVDTFLGVLLGLSTKSYNDSEDKYDGRIDVTNGANDSKVFSLVLHSDPEDLEQKPEVLFKVNPS